jgi:nucleoside-diphosphate-sugar epimerase
MLEYARCYGVRIKVVRIFNTYGPRMDPEDGRIISTFIVQALRGEPITIFGDGTQTRCFCYVDDLVDGLVRMAASDPSFTGPVNLGSPAELTVLEVAGIIKEMTGSPSETVFLAVRPDDPRRRKPDISLAESRLGWRPRFSFEQGAARTIEFFKATIE